MLLLATLMLCAMASPDDLMLLLTTWSLRYATGGVFCWGPASCADIAMAFDIRGIRGMKVETESSSPALPLPP